MTCCADRPLGTRSATALRLCRLDFFPRKVEDDKMLGRPQQRRTYDPDVRVSRGARDVTAITSYNRPATSAAPHSWGEDPMNSEKPAGSWGARRTVLHAVVCR